MAKEYATHEIKVQTLWRVIMKCSEIPIPAIKEKLLAECGKKWGTARQTAQGLLKELEAGEYIHIDGEEIWSYERWGKILEAREGDYLKMQDIISGQIEL